MRSKCSVGNTTSYTDIELGALRLFEIDRKRAAVVGALRRSVDIIAWLAIDRRLDAEAEAFALPVLRRSPNACRGS